MKNPRPDAAEAALVPGDPHDGRLLEVLRPTGWRNPEPRGRYHLVVLGGGTGGLVSAAIAAGLGARVALVERHLLGGDCLNTGCVPSKAVLRAAAGWAAAREAAGRFGGPPVSGTGSFAAAMERMRRIRADISVHDGAERFRGLGADVFLGDARFTGPDRVEVDGRELRFRRAILATGARPALPPIPGLREAEPLTSETLFALTHLPPRLAVIGAGPIGCEMAQAFARFGSRVTLLESGARILPHDDADAAGVVRAALERDGVEVCVGASASGVQSAGGLHRLRAELPGGEREWECERILVATGREPAVDGLGLERAGVRVGSRGVETDHRLRTTNPRVYAVGDVNGRAPFTHAADAQARMAVQNALFFGRKRVDDLVIPWCTYTAPELAQVGLTLPEAQERGLQVDVLTLPLEQVDRARLDGATEGFLRVLLRRGTDRIEGATLVAEHAGDLIAPLTIAISSGLGLDRLGSAVFPYPTLSEAVRKLADARRRERLTPLAQRAFDLFFRLTGAP